jgi:hypothetical protein
MIRKPAVEVATGLLTDCGGRLARSPKLCRLYRATRHKPIRRDAGGAFRFPQIATCDLDIAVVGQLPAKFGNEFGPGALVKLAAFNTSFRRVSVAVSAGVVVIATREFDEHARLIAHGPRIVTRWQ